MSNGTGNTGLVIAGVFQNLLIFLNFGLVVLFTVLWAVAGKEPALLDLVKFFGGALVGQAVGYGSRAGSS